MIVNFGPIYQCNRQLHYGAATESVTFGKKKKKGFSTGICMTVLFNMDDTSFSFLFFTNTLLHIKLRPTLSESNLSKNGLSIFYAELKEPYIYMCSLTSSTRFM